MQNIPSKRGNMEIGPALAAVIIIAVVALGGVFFYKNMIEADPKDIADHTVIRVHKPLGDDQNDELDQLAQTSDSDDIAAIEQDLDVDADIDLSALDSLEEELLDLEDLDNIDFDL